MANSNIRRAIIREWMSLAREKRQSSQQARTFAKVRWSDIDCRAAVERRMRRSWRGCLRGPGVPDLSTRADATASWHFALPQVAETIQSFSGDGCAVGECLACHFGPGPRI
jgi:hypothetical protein